MKRLGVLITLIVLCCVSVAAGQSTRPFTVDELLKVRRVADPQVSPDNRSIAYTVTDIDKETNRRTTQIYLISTEGGEPRALTGGAAESTSPRWSPDGKRLAFISARDGEPQIWIIEMAGGALKKLTNISTGADNPVWSPDGQLIAFTSEIYPECTTDECNRGRAGQAATSKAKIADRLLFRHWNSWKEGKRTHVFVVSSQGGVARDLTPGDYDAPPFSLGGPPDYSFSPDSKELAFARNTDKTEATSTNGDIFVVPVAGGPGVAAERITGNNPANDLSPLYSPDGRYLAYRGQGRPGFESDRWQLMLYDRRTRQTRSLTAELDSWVEGFAFSPDGGRIYFVASERGRQPIYSVPTGGGPIANITKIVADGFNDDVRVTADGRTLVFTRHSMTQPIEIYLARADGTGIIQRTSINNQFLAGFNLKPAEETTWEGADGAKVHGFIVKPANFTLSRKWPLLVLIHGGPQGAWSDAWSYRWNPQVFADAGYVVFMPNPRGSTGYGQKFVDDISGDWGGKAFTDITNGVASMVARSEIDRGRVGAAGASYGGYMINWIEGHNDDPRFQYKALVSHAGVYNLTSMYGATEELWFTDWEFGGAPWDNPEMYARWSPHMFVKNFKTPLLVVHGELDYRVPVTEGLQLFTALQRRGVPSKLLYFPDEGHWIGRPQNSALWYNTVLQWFATHLNPKANP